MRINKCQHCGSSNIVKSKIFNKFGGEIGAMPYDKTVSFNTTALFAEICSDCGVVVSLKVKDPEKLK